MRRAQWRSAGGFTLIEVLMALTVFALIAAIAYGAMATAGQGFQILNEERDKREGEGWIARQLRSDVRYLSSSFWKGEEGAMVAPIRIRNDNRGGLEFDELFLLVKELGLPGVDQVHYYIDEEKGHLMRESRLLWARSGVEPVRWDMGEAASWAVEAMSADGHWRQEWDGKGKSNGAFVWPAAIRVRMKIAADGGEREWYLPVRFGMDL